MIEVESLTRRYGAYAAVDDVSFSVHPGTVTGFLGPNGAGKSTCMRMICGLTPPTSGVATVMSNEGLMRAMTEAGIKVARTDVGDRYVLEEMRRGGFSLGGEQSGHVILLEHGTTGDGVLTGLMLAARVASTGRPLAELAACMTRLPQCLVNVRDVNKHAVDGHPVVQNAVADAERDLGGLGRVLLRKSGTEPVVRVMVEAASAERAQQIAEHLAAVVANELALAPA